MFHLFFYDPLTGLLNSSACLARVALARDFEMLFNSSKLPKCLQISEMLYTFSRFYTTHYYRPVPQAMPPSLDTQTTPQDQPQDQPQLSLLISSNDAKMVVPPSKCFVQPAYARCATKVGNHEPLQISSNPPSYIYFASPSFINKQNT